MASASAPPPAPTAVPASNVPGVGTGSNRLTIVTAIVALIVVAAAGAYTSFVRADRTATLATRNREITQLKQQLGSPERVKAGSLADQFKLGVSSLQSVLAEASPWTPLLAAVADRTPPEVILTALTADAKLNLRINGTAGSYSDVAKFMAGLTGSSQFSQVTLDTTAKSDSAAGTAVTFALKATYVPTAATSKSSTTNGSDSSEPATNAATSNGSANDAQ